MMLKRLLMGCAAGVLVMASIPAGAQERTLGEFLKAAPKLSLMQQGLLDKPSAPLLGVNGKKDDQAPVEDIYLLMEHGGPKEARIYPNGGHMGRTPGMDSAEIAKMIVDWLKLRLSQ